MRKSRQINKKGVSEIVVTVSMILLAIIGVSIIAAFIIPMVQKQLQKAGSCVELRTHYAVNTASSATCYTSEQLNVSIQRGWEKGDSKGFAITIHGSAGKSRAEKETSGLPSKGGANLYSYDIRGIGNVERVSIATILQNDEICDSVDYTGLNKC